MANGNVNEVLSRLYQLPYPEFMRVCVQVCEKLNENRGTSVEPHELANALGAVAEAAHRPTIPPYRPADTKTGETTTKIGDTLVEHPDGVQITSTKD